MLLNKHPEERKDEKLVASLSAAQQKPDYFVERTDHEIWSLFKNGHEGAFRYIYERHIDVLYSYGQRFTPNKEVIRDCMQDLFVELRNSKKLSNTNSIKFYLLKAFRNKLKRTLNQNSRFTMVSVNEWFLTNPAQPSVETVIIESRFKEEQKARLRSAINELPARQREALYYFYQENLTYAEVAEIMGFSYVRSARNMIYKAIEALRQALNS